MVEHLGCAPKGPRHTIDITPGAGWRRAGRTSITAAVLIMVLPLLWLLGVLLVLGFLGGATAMLASAFARQRWRSRRSGDRVIDLVDSH